MRFKETSKTLISALNITILTLFLGQHCMNWMLCNHERFGILCQCLHASKHTYTLVLGLFENLILKLHVFKVTINQKDHLKLPKTGLSIWSIALLVLKSFRHYFTTVCDILLFIPHGLVLLCSSGGCKFCGICCGRLSVAEVAATNQTPTPETKRSH